MLPLGEVMLKSASLNHLGKISCQNFGWENIIYPLSPSSIFSGQTPSQRGCSAWQCHWTPTLPGESRRWPQRWSHCITAHCTLVLYKNRFCHLPWLLGNSPSTAWMMELLPDPTGPMMATWTRRIRRREKQTLAQNWSFRLCRVVLTFKTGYYQETFIRNPQLKARHKSKITSVLGLLVGSFLYCLWVLPASRRRQWGSWCPGWARSLPCSTCRRHWPAPQCCPHSCRGPSQSSSQPLCPLVSLSLAAAKNPTI